ncbi:hypothetical protein [Enterococcus sp. SMC-9]|uniref:hypothetical protein n=1 Tax=Enterococcus sp. SMC-9 TaxID=2862343 RepID=UPI001E47BF7F|nr:hypothetical protein [Enterococcus sp. SMC-9]
MSLQIFGNFDLFLSGLVRAAGSKKSGKRWVTLWKNVGNLDADVLYQNQIFEFFPKSWCLKLDLKKAKSGGNTKIQKKHPFR